MEKSLKGKGRRCIWGARLVLSLVLSAICPVAGYPEPVPGTTHQVPVGVDVVLYKKALQSFSRNDFSGSRKELKKILSEHPHSVETGPSWLLLARIEGRSAENLSRSRKTRYRAMRRALRFFWKAHDALPSGWDQGRVSWRMGQMMARMGFYPEAKGYLELSVREAPSGPRFFSSRLLLAEILRKEGHLRQAKRIVDRLSARLDLSQSTSGKRILPLLYEQARIGMDRGEDKKAGDFLKKALSLDGGYPYKHPDDLFVLALYADRSAHNRRAFTLYREFRRFGPESPLVPEALYRMALLSGRLGKTSSMEARLLELVHEYPDSGWSDRARLEVARLQGKKAQKRFYSGKPHRKSPLDKKIERLLDVNLKNGSVSSRVLSLSMTAPLLARRGQWREALRALHRIQSDIDPGSPEGKRLSGLETALVAGWVLRQEKPFRPERIRKIVRSYGYALKAGIRDPKPTPFEIDGEKAVPDAFRLEGESLAQGGDNVAAIRWYRKALQTANLSLRVKVLGDLVRLERKSGNLSGAWADGQTLLQALPPSSIERPVWMGRLARIARRMGESGTEEKFLREEIREYPEDESSGRTLVRLFGLDLGNANPFLAEQDAQLARSFLDNSRDPDDRKALGDLLYRWGKMERDLHHPRRAYRLLESFRTAYREDPRSGWAAYQLGNLALVLGDPEKARDWFLKVAREKAGSSLGKVARERARGIRLEQDLATRGY
ncbi:MAG: tetratricopeptide repeat protein [Nitrospirae bacterium]|nr:tetratricopeptide repeat protein [Nitrospirota bacterium]